MASPEREGRRAGQSLDAHEHGEVTRRKLLLEFEVSVPITANP